MSEEECGNPDCIEGWVWTQLGEFPEPCPLCSTQEESFPSDDSVQD